VTTDDRAYCWGASEWGQLGIGVIDNQGPEQCNTHPCSTRPAAVLGGLRFRSVSAGYQFTCGATTDDRVYCWGRNEQGQLGTGTLTRSDRPIAVAAGGRRFRQVRAGGAHACAISTSSEAFCWGYNPDGRLGNGTTTSRTTPVRVSRGLLWRQLSVDFAHSCGVTTDGQAYCWGGRIIGDGTMLNRLKPARVGGGMLFREIEAGFSHTCAVNIGYRAYCWGSNSSGELGDGSRTARLTPTLVVGDRRFEHVDAGGGASCGVTRTGQGVCWGTGNLGNGSSFRRATPTPIAGTLKLATITVLGAGCGVTVTSQAYCWGGNFTGQVGDGSSTDRLRPVAVLGPAS
jgi:alpha-tubulin suppressor-like RCC1 family protein